MEIGDAIAIAKIVGAHGVKGTCKVYCYGECEQVFTAGRDIIVKTAAGVLARHEIEWFKPHGRTFLLALKGITDRSHIEKLLGADILIGKSQLPELAVGTYYWHQLIGLSVYTIEGRFLGRLRAVMPTGSNDVYVVRKNGGGSEEEILIPALRSVVVEVDLERKRMRVDLPEGL